MRAPPEIPSSACRLLDTTCWVEVAWPGSSTTMSGHTFEVMDQEFNAWWTAYTCISPHMAMVAARRKQFLANLPQPERNLTVIIDAMAHSPLGHS